jgi:hypothetical protein
MNTVATDLAGVLEDAAAHLYVLRTERATIARPLRANAVHTLTRQNTVQTDAKKRLEKIVAAL